MKNDLVEILISYLLIMLPSFGMNMFKWLYFGLVSLGPDAFCAICVALAVFVGVCVSVAIKRK